MIRTHWLEHYILQRFSVTFDAMMLNYIERLVSDLIELSTRHHFALWLAAGEISAAGRAAFPAEQRKVSLGSGTEYGIIEEQVRCSACHVI